MPPTGSNPNLWGRYPQAYEQDVDKLRGITQGGQRPFVAVEVDPVALFAQAPAGTRATIDPQYLIQLFGRDPNIDNDWISKEFQLAGNFLKVSFLPSRNNQTQTALSTNTANAIKDNSLAVTGSGAGTSSMSRVLILHFDDQKDTPHLLGDGDIFYLPQFSKIIVTFGPNSPRVRLLAGYNAAVLKNDDNQRSLNAQPSFGPGFGLWENPSYHCTPFAINQNLSAGQASAAVALANNATNNTDLIVQTGVLANQGTQGFGVAPIWITNVDVTVKQNVVGKDVNVQASLIVRDSSGALVRTLDVIQLQNANTLATGTTSDFRSKQYTLPIRASLRAGDKLTMRIVNGDVTNAINTFWTITGFAYGQIWTASAGTAFHITPQLSEHPFPGDSVETGQVNP